MQQNARQARMEQEGLTFALVRDTINNKSEEPMEIKRAVVTTTAGKIVITAEGGAVLGSVPDSADAEVIAAYREAVAAIIRECAADFTGELGDVELE